MRTSLDEIRKLEAYALGQHSPQESLLMQARLHLDEVLAEKLADQLKVYPLIKQFGRKQLKDEIRNIETQLFEKEQHRNFKEKILSIFNR